jgi:hypothetical protein
MTAVVNRLSLNVGELFERQGMVSPSRSDLMTHWLLNSAALRPVMLGELFPWVKGQSLNVKPVPGARPQGYADGLQDLYERDLIQLQSSIAGDDVSNIQGVRRVLEHFLSLPEVDPGSQVEVFGERRDLPTRQVTFTLTHLGGEAWERLAEPQWVRFLSGGIDLDGFAELVSPNRELLVAYMGWYPELKRIRVRWQTVELQSLENLEVLYWKRLPSVYRVTFSVEPADPCWGPIQPRWFQDWHHSIMRWYTKPWELADWPST